jgi:hypothetical protein
MLLTASPDDLVVSCATVDPAVADVLIAVTSLESVLTFLVPVLLLLALLLLVSLLFLASLMLLAYLLLLTFLLLLDIYC